jgi:hypothetical protein
MPPDRVLPRHHIFLLNIWEERRDRFPYRTYQFSLEAVRTEERYGFDTPGCLLAHL